MFPGPLLSRKWQKSSLAVVASFVTRTALGETADAVYFGGPIVTMIRDGDRVEALAVKDGLILKTGSRADVMAFKGPETKLDFCRN